MAAYAGACTSIDMEFACSPSYWTVTTSEPCTVNTAAAMTAARVRRTTARTSSSPVRAVERALYMAALEATKSAVCSASASRNRPPLLPPRTRAVSLLP